MTATWKMYGSLFILILLGNRSEGASTGIVVRLLLFGSVATAPTPAVGEIEEVAGLFALGRNAKEVAVLDDDEEEVGDEVEEEERVGVHEDARDLPSPSPSHANKKEQQGEGRRNSRRMKTGRNNEREQRGN